MKLRLLLVFLLLTMFIVPSFTSAETNSTFEKVLAELRSNYGELTTESCGAASSLYGARMQQQNIKFRFINLFTNPYDGYQTHVAVEVWIPEWNKWVYVDPTFNGYYKSGNSPLSAFEIREYAVEQEFSSLTWVQNGGPKERYDITKYYLNPLYLFKGLMYAGRHYIVDEHMPPFKKEDSIFNYLHSITPITHPKEIEEMPFYGLDQEGPGVVVPSWNNYKTIKRTDGEWIRVTTEAGGVVAKIPVEYGKFYTFEVPIRVYKGAVTVSEQNGWIKVYEGTNKTRYFKSRIFGTPTNELTIYLYSDQPVDFEFKPSQTIVREVINDFKDSVQIINTP